MYDVPFLCIHSYLLNNNVVILTKNASKPPINAPTMIEITITIIVNFIVSSRVGHVTFLSSATTSLINRPGATLEIAGLAGCSIIPLYRTSNLTKTPSQGFNTYYTKLGRFCKEVTDI